MKAGIRTGATLAAALALFAIAVLAAIPAGASSGGGPVSKSACNLSDDEINGGLGASYVYTLNVRNLGCDKGKKLVKKFHRCRHHNGGANGKCNGIKGYSCNEKVTAKSEHQFSAKAKCTKGSKKFKQTFAENT